MHKYSDRWHLIDEADYDDEWEAIFTDETAGRNYEFRQHLKNFASDPDVLDTAPKQFIEKIALQIILGYYLRSLEASGYSPLHPSFGKYASAFCHNWRISPLRICPKKYGTEWLDALCEKYNAHPNEQLPLKRTYWGDCENSEIYADKEKYGHASQWTHASERVRQREERKKLCKNE